jgi:hypothetical protein
MGIDHRGVMPITIGIEKLYDTDWGHARLG